MRTNTTNHRQPKARRNRPANSGQGHFSPMEPLEARELMSAAVYTVTNTLDNTHKGSLRWAINQVNKDAGKKGTDTINFDIGGASAQTIAPLSQLPTLKYSAVIDATTQPGYTDSPLIQINGSQMPGYAGTDALVLNGDGSTVKGLEFEHFSRAIVANGDNDLITENVIGIEPPTFNGTDDGFTKAIDIYGSNTTVSNNNVDSHEGSGIMLESQSNSNTVSGNSVTGGQFGINDSVDSDHNQFNGNTVGGNYTGIEIDGHYNQVGDGKSADSNIIGVYDNPNAIGVELNSGQNAVTNNYISYNGEVGIYMGYNDSATDTVTGQVKSIAGSHNTVQDNFIAYNEQNGITLDNVHGNTIGGTGTVANGDSQSNTIFGNYFDGIYVGTGSFQNTFSNNSIDYNGSFGIELATGANDSQAAPTLMYADAYGLATPDVTGTFQGAANSTYHIEFFATDSGKANQGAEYMGSADFTTDSQGYLLSASSTESTTRPYVSGSGSTAQFSVGFEKEIPSETTVLTATATSQIGDTSAFSNGVKVFIAS